MCFDDFIRNGYYGGRVEVFGNYEKDSEHVKYFDFSGMYASCMAEKFHVGDPVFSICNNFTKPGFYKIIFKSNFDIPILPYKNNGKLMFMNGVMEGIY
jgi:hypothetical protein